jgi:hypothetical protein
MDLEEYKEGLGYAVLLLDRVARLLGYHFKKYVLHNHTR